MSVRLPDYPIDRPDPFTTPATQVADNDIASTSLVPGDTLPPGHPGRCDAADVRHRSWRRRPSVRTTSFRHRRPLELRS